VDEMDLEELKEMFLEECREHVDTLERGLLEMSNPEHSSDLLNEVFRAAHSIKGGGATFGFAELAELTHHMETLLDQQRSGSKAVVDEDIELLLESLDVVRELMESLGNEDHPDRLALQKRLAEAVGGAASAAGSSESELGDSVAEAHEASSEPGWSIGFKPKPDLMQKGNDPLLVIKELHRLGELSISLDESWLPPWEFFDPKICYVPWEAELRGELTHAGVMEAFEWVEQDCDLVLSQLPIAQQATTEAGDTTSLAAEETVARKKADDPILTPAAPPDLPGKDKLEPKAAKAKSSSNSETASIRVSTEKIDQLINLVGELVITQSMLTGLSEDVEAVDAEQLRDRLSELERNTRQLQEGVMRVRMLPLSVGFGRLPRLVRDLSKKLDKRVDLVLEGSETEIDKTVLEQMMDPLIHLVRNAVDHGLESPSERRAAGKRETGELKLSAYHHSGSVVIEISDDGAGIDSARILRKAVERGVVASDDSLSESEIQRLIFAPGFSTAEVVSDVSGRGVGMDVVRRNILDLGGHVDISSTLGAGTTVTIRLPLTLAILDGQMIACGDEVFVIPLSNIIETIEVSDSRVSDLPQSGSVFHYREEYLPLLGLHETFELDGCANERLIVVMESHGQLFGIAIDRVLGQQQIVIKALEDNYEAVPGIAGATIMSDGSVALIVDPPALAPVVNLTNAA